VPLLLSPLLSATFWYANFGTLAAYGGRFVQHAGTRAGQGGKRRRAVPESDLGSEGFSEFVAGALPGLLRFGHVLTGSPQEAEDLAQEALSTCLRRWRRARADDPFAYARKAMINAYLTLWRRRGSRVRRRSVPDAVAEFAAPTRLEEWDVLQLTLAQLPQGQRAVLVLRYLEDLPDYSIAALLGCRPGTVRSRAGRGLAALRPLMTIGTTGMVGGSDAPTR
jgi:RNA polymerase sigma-70 factor (sigma-E family)